MTAVVDLDIVERVPPNDQVAALVPGAFGLLFIVLAVAKPRIFWEAPRTVRLRARLGDRLYAGMFLLLGLALVAGVAARVIGR